MVCSKLVVTLSIILYLVTSLNSQANNELCSKNRKDEFSRNIKNQTNYLEKSVASKHQEVSLDIFFMDIFNLDEKLSSIQIAVLASLTWVNLDLDINCTLESNSAPFIIRPEMFFAWKPIFSLFGIRDASVMHSPDRTDSIVISSGGHFEWIVQMKITVGCEMNFLYFPFDDMVCVFWLNPFDRDVSIQWGKIKYDNVISTLKSHKMTTIETGRFEYEKMNIPICSIYLKRYVTYYIFTCYIPTLLTVIVAWFGFSVDAGAAPARMTLGVSSLLALFVQYGNISDSIPKVGYVKAIDMWMLFCALFIVSTLFEYAIICYFRKTTTSSGTKSFTEMEARCVKLDRLSLIVYPIMVLIASIIYCAVTMLVEPDYYYKRGFI